MNKRETHIVTGMTRDLAANRVEPSLVYDAHNIRIRVVGNNSTLLSVTNEKGTSEFEITNADATIKGTIIGSASFTNTLILFTVDTGEQEDYIYRIDFDETFDTATLSLLFNGGYCHSQGIEGLGFSVLHPIEALAVYENDEIQKVYWVDGINQPRMINICKGEQNNPDAFNFNREIGVGAKMSITKYNSGGEFRPGTVQYCFNYFNKFAQETNIVDVSPLYYISPKDSGLAADDTSGCSFEITLSDLNTDFDFVRLYAIYRSSENATPNVRIVGDYGITSTESTVYKLENFTHPETALQYQFIDVPFDDLWVIDSNHKIKYNVYQKYGPHSGSTNLIVPLGQDEYLYSSNGDVAFCLYNYDRGGNIVPVKKSSITVITHAGGLNYYSIPNVASALESSILVQAAFTSTSELKPLTIVDNGIIGSTIDASSLLFMGGQYIIAGTLAEKDNTLFLGNIKNAVPNIGDITINNEGVQVAIKDLSGTALIDVQSCAFGFNSEKLDGYTPEHIVTELLSPDIFIHEKDNNRSSNAIKSFKARENYRLGFIAQYKTGQWSEVVWLGDFTEQEMNSVNQFFPNTEYEYEQGESCLLNLWGQQFRSAGFESILNSKIVDALISNGFIKIAPVVVYPQISERFVVCQGLLCSTVFNISDRIENAPFSQCDWRFRKGYSWRRIVDEIQCNATTTISSDPIDEIYAPDVPFAHYKDSGASAFTDLDSIAFKRYFGSEYYRDPSVLTFHSPDIDSSDEILKDNIESLKLRIVGFSNGGFETVRQGRFPVSFSTASIEQRSYIHYYIEMENLGFGRNSELLIPNTTKVTPSTYFEYYSYNPEGFAQYIERFGGSLKINGYKDRLILNNGDTEEGATYYSWLTYLWHRNGSLNGQYDATNVDYENKSNPQRVATYKRKCTSEKTFGSTTYFFNGDSVVPFDINTSSISLCETEARTVFVKSQFKDNVSYYGFSNKVVVPVQVKSDGVSFYDYTESEGDAHTRASNESWFAYPVRTVGYYDKTPDSYPSAGTIISYDNFSAGIDPVQIRYNTTRHALISLKSDDDSIVSQLGETDVDSAYVFWLNQTKSFSGFVLQDEFFTNGENQTINSSFANECIYIGELYREFTQEQLNSRFGGNSQEAIAANVWTLAGEAVDLVSGNSATIDFKEGDTYFGRYECLKAYPYSQEDKQSIVSIYSTELESRVNLDFRYGNTMNLDDNTLVTPQNFNLFNHEGYEQTNQFFTYKALDYDRYVSQNFPNMITWSLEKTFGEDVDSWTSIPLTNTLDLDGTKGEVTKLARFNNEIFSFQNNGFAQILFNSRVQIPVSDGQPIEITNGYKVDGKRYISETIGMSNKWSLGITPQAMYFIDDSKNTLYAFSGQLIDLSTTKGMKTWLYDEGNDFRPVWNPRDYGNVRTFYDRIYGDLYFTTENYSLVYSEILGNFTSFMDYGGVSSMNNIGNKFLSFTTESNETSKMWEMWEGDYNMFFGEFKPYWITFISNTDPTMDKVFNNLEWRSVSYDSEGNYIPYDTFDTLRVWHEHQDTGCVSLEDKKDTPSILKKKFNAFRTFVPRDYKGVWSLQGMQRIRNPWAYIRLANTQENTNQMIFTDLNVDFFE